MEDSYVLQLQEPKFREFYLSYSGYAQCGPLHCYGPASRPHYLIHFVVKGKGMYQASGQKHYHCRTGVSDRAGYTDFLSGR